MAIYNEETDRDGSNMTNGYLDMKRKSATMTTMSTSRIINMVPPKKRKRMRPSNNDR